MSIHNYAINEKIKQTETIISLYGQPVQWSEEEEMLLSPPHPPKHVHTYTHTPFHREKRCSLPFH